MLKRNSKNNVVKEIKENKIVNAFNIIPNLSDKVLDYNEDKFNVCDLVNDIFEDKRKYESGIPSSLFIFSGVQARMKQQFAVSELPLSLTSKSLTNSIGFNISYDSNDSLLKESNIRSFLGKYEITNVENIDMKKVFNNYFISFFNEFTKTYLEVSRIISNIHTLDCSILDVNYFNKNYEYSTITTKGGKKLRGYKIGVLRGITDNGGVIEEIRMDTAKTSDIDMTRDMMIESSYLKQGDYLLMDRGFIDIVLFKALNDKGVYVIIPVRKNMEIYIEAVNMAKEKSNWHNHPNNKRNGQTITLVEGLERAWLETNDKNKKPEKLNLNYKINGCVIRFEKDKCKDVLTDEEIIATDDKYAYAVIITNNTQIDECDIIRMYEMRPEIEEDFRQLKDFWGLNRYKSTKYNIISFVILISLLGYNFYQVFKESEEGKEYIGKNFIVEERHGLYIVKGVRTAIVTEHYFGIFEMDELLDLYANLDVDKRQIIKKYLII